MKQGLTQPHAIEFGLNLDEVEKIKFKYAQKFTKRLVDYPSDEATRRPGTNIIDILWTPAENYQFLAGQPIYLDAIVTMKNSRYNPNIPTVEFKLLPTYFTQDEAEAAHEEA